MLSHGIHSGPPEALATAEVLATTAAFATNTAISTTAPATNTARSFASSIGMPAAFASGTCTPNTRTSARSLLPKALLARCLLVPALTSDSWVHWVVWARTVHDGTAPGSEVRPLLEACHLDAGMRRVRGTWARDRLATAAACNLGRLSACATDLVGRVPHAIKPDLKRATPSGRLGAEAAWALALVRWFKGPGTLEACSHLTGLWLTWLRARLSAGMAARIQHPCTALLAPSGSHLGRLGAMAFEAMRPCLRTIWAHDPLPERARIDLVASVPTLPLVLMSRRHLAGSMRADDFVLAIGGIVAKARGARVAGSLASVAFDATTQCLFTEAATDGSREFRHIHRAADLWLGFRVPRAY